MAKVMKARVEQLDTPHTKSSFRKTRRWLKRQAAKARRRVPVPERPMSNRYGGWIS